MSSSTESLWGIPLVVLIWCLYKVLRNAFRHPDTPYFIKGLYRYALLFLRRAAEVVRSSFLGIPLRYRPLLSERMLASLVGVVLLLFCAAVGDWPYNFYIFSRIVVTGVLVVACARVYRSHHAIWSVTSGVVALVFNPLAPFHFSKESWHLLNVLAASAIMLLIVLSRTNNKEHTDRMLPGDAMICVECERLDREFVSIRAKRTMAAMQGQATKALDEKELELLGKILSHKTEHAGAPK